MDSHDRWLLAQGYELGHWQKLARRIRAGRTDLRWYRWKADRTASRLQEAGAGDLSRFESVEIGSGPIGMVGFLPGVRHCAVDPLLSDYERDSELIADRPGDVRYISAKGESIPLPESSFDLVVIDNCLDHCEDPRQVLQECSRLLKPRGYLYVTLNVRTPLGVGVRRLMEAAHVDRGHPHSYDTTRLSTTISSQGFEIQRWWLQAWTSSLRENWGQSSLKTLAKLGTFTLERLYEGVWRKGVSPAATPQPQP